MILLFSIPFGSISHARTFIPKQDDLGINMVWEWVLTQINNSLMQVFSHLDIPSAHPISMPNITILICRLVL